MLKSILSFVFDKNKHKKYDEPPSYVSLQKRLNNYRREEEIKEIKILNFFLFLGALITVSAVVWVIIVLFILFPLSN